MRQSLSELLNNKRHKGFNLKPSGEVEITILEGDTVVSYEKVHNLATPLLKDAWLTYFYHPGVPFSGQYMFISNDTDDMHKRKSVIRSTFVSSMIRTALNSFVNDTIHKTWTTTATFNPPATTRTFQIIGIAPGNETALATYARVVNQILCATKLTSVQTQTPTQTLQILYRISLARV